MSDRKKQSKRKNILSEHPVAGTHVGGSLEAQSVFDTSSPQPQVQTQETPAPLPQLGRRERQDIPFHSRNKTENIQLDRRLLVAYHQLLRKKGRNKTDALNHIILEACLREGIEVDPYVLEKPFSFDDVPEQYR